MDSVEYVKKQFAGMRRQVDVTLKDITKEQFNWNPGGTANSISSTFIHMLSSEDYFIQGILLGKNRTWETENWGEKIGLSSAPGSSQIWDEMKNKIISLEPVLAYAGSVYAATETYFEGLTAVELDRKIAMFNGERPVADALSLLVVHNLSHAGEIAAIKGIQGLKGLPF